VAASKNSSPKAILYEFLPVTVKVSELLQQVVISIPFTQYNTGDFSKCQKWAQQ